MERPLTGELARSAIGMIELPPLDEQVLAGSRALCAARLRRRGGAPAAPRRAA